MINNNCCIYSEYYGLLDVNSFDVNSIVISELEKLNALDVKRPDDIQKLIKIFDGFGELRSLIL